MDIEFNLPENMENEGNAMRRIWIIVLFCLLLCKITFSQTPQWQQIFHTVLSQTNYFTIDSSGNFYSSSLNTGLLISKDKGKSWQSLDVGKNETIKKVAVNSRGYIFVHTRFSYLTRLYRSKNNGQTWDTLKIQSAGKNFEYFNFFIEPDDKIFTLFGSHLYLSNDDGDTWIPQTFIQDLDTRGFEIIDNTYFAFGMYYGTRETGIIFASSDSGKTWRQAVIKKNAAPTYNVPFFKTSNGQIITSAVIVLNGKITIPYLYVTSNFGESWDSVRTPILFTGFCEDRKGNILAHGLYDPGFYRSSDDGHSWEMVEAELYSSQISNIKKDADGTLYAISGEPGFSTVIYSNDNGKIWTELTGGLPELNVMELRIVEPAIIETFSRDGFFRSTDFGSNWRTLNKNLNKYDLARYFLLSDTLIFTYDNGWSNIEFPPRAFGLFKYIWSLNKWVRVTSGASITDMARDSRDTLYMLRSKEWPEAEAMFTSSDYGLHWYKKTPPDFTISSPIAIEINSKDEIFIINKQSELFKSSDYGKSYEKMSVGTSLFLSLRINNNGVIFSVLKDTLQNEQALYRSSDDGITWTPVKANGFPKNPVYKTYFDSYDRMFVITQKQISLSSYSYALYFSPDNGDTWTNITGNLDSLAITSVTEADGRVYAGTSEKGIFMLEDSFLTVKESRKPISYSLNQNYPNPFNSSTVISYSIPSSSNVELKIYDILGREVATLINVFQSAGSYNISFDAGSLSTGIYFYRITAGRFSDVKKFILLK